MLLLQMNHTQQAQKGRGASAAVVEYYALQQLHTDVLAIGALVSPVWTLRYAAPSCSS